MFTDAEIDLLRALKTYAEDHVVTLDRVHRMLEGKERPVGDFKEHVINVAGHRVVYSVEDQGPGRGILRHISVTQHHEHVLDKQDRQYAFESICQELGFVKDSSVRSKIWTEGGTPFGNAVNMLQEVPYGDELLRKIGCKEQMPPLSPGGPG